MSASRAPVFRKDVRSLMKPLGAILALQALYSLGFLLLFRYVEGAWPPLAALGEINVLAAIAFGQIFGLVAACYVFAEEKLAGTEAFLRRLSAPRIRITAEKLAAGFAVLALLLAIQVSLHVAALPWGGLWPSGPTPVGILEDAMSWLTSPAVIVATLVAATFGSYVVGVLVSLVSKQPLVIVVVGYALESIAYGFAMIPVDDPLFVSWDVAWINLILYVPLLLVPLFAATPGSRFRIPGTGALLSSGRAPFAGLVWKSINENGALHLLALAFLAGAFLAPSGLDTALVSGGAVLLLGALGTASYAPEEKQGLHCLLYQHPVPRSQLFLAKTGAGVLPALAVSLALLVFLGRPGSDILTLLAYAALAYGSAVLMTLTFERAVIALLAAVSLVTMTLLLPMLAIELRPRVADVDFAFGGAVVMVRSGAAGGGPVLVTLGLTVPAILLAAGCLWAARRMAVDPGVLTGTPGDRIRSALRLYAGIVALTTVVTLVWWRQPLALIG